MRTGAAPALARALWLKHRPGIARVTSPPWSKSARAGPKATPRTWPLARRPCSSPRLEVAVLMSALANGGTVLIAAPGRAHRTAGPAHRRARHGSSPSGVVRDHLGVSARSMDILHQAMLADTEDPEGTGKRAAVPGLHICAKTGTAQVQTSSGHTHRATPPGLLSFATYDKPQYAVVVMIENGASRRRHLRPHRRQDLRGH